MKLEEYSKSRDRTSPLIAYFIAPPTTPHPRRPQPGNTCLDGLKNIDTGNRPTGQGSVMCVCMYGLRWADRITVSHEQVGIPLGLQCW